VGLDKDASSNLKTSTKLGTITHKLSEQDLHQEAMTKSQQRLQDVYKHTKLNTIDESTTPPELSEYQPTQSSDRWLQLMILCLSAFFN
jgi:hypothetical protein